MCEGDFQRPAGQGDSASSQPAPLASEGGRSFLSPVRIESINFLKKKKEEEEEREGEEEQQQGEEGRPGTLGARRTDWHLCSHDLTGREGCRPR